jgi:hypothetical protein
LHLATPPPVRACLTVNQLTAHFVARASRALRVRELHVREIASAASHAVRGHCARDDDMKQHTDQEENKKKSGWGRTVCARMFLANMIKK